LALTQHLVK